MQRGTGQSARICQVWTVLKRHSRAISYCHQFNFQNMVGTKSRPKAAMSVGALLGRPLLPRPDLPWCVHLRADTAA